MENNNPTPRSVFIEAREWSDKVNGNSYFSSRLWLDGEIALTLGGLHYGYGDFFIHQTLKAAADSGLIPANWDCVRAIRDAGVSIYTAKKPSLKREMFKAGYHD